MTLQLILHIGMGKTGTSSIQRALADNAAHLREKGTCYLGMWFDAIDAKFHGYEGYRAFTQLPAEELVVLADAFVANLQKMQDDTGCGRFILSNESIFGSEPRLAPFIAAVAAKIDVKLIAYVRPPQSWLSSAYAQWMLMHKPKGPLMPFAERSRQLISVYRTIKLWKEDFAANLVVRRHDSRLDVVADFAETAGISFDVSPKRVLERSENAELLLRGLFNSYYTDEVMPQRFNNLIFNRDKAKVHSIEELTQMMFDQNAADEIIAENAETFTFIRDEFGLDFFNEGKARVESVDTGALRNRVNDYLLEIVLRQAIRLKKLEKQVEALSEGKAAEE